MEYPKDFGVSKRAPTQEEMDWLNNWITKQNIQKGVKILEFGCGITSWVIFNSFPKVEKYVSVENFEPCMQQVKKYVPAVQFVNTTWYDIPKDKYDFVFVDASTCAPPDLKSIRKGEIVFRDDAIHYAMDFVADDCYFAVHDWCYRGGWLRPKMYFEERGYELVDCIRTKCGLGIYQKSRRKT